MASASEPPSLVITPVYPVAKLGVRPAAVALAPTFGVKLGLAAGMSSTPLFATAGLGVLAGFSVSPGHGGAGEGVGAAAIISDPVFIDATEGMLAVSIVPDTTFPGAGLGVLAGTFVTPVFPDLGPGAADPLVITPVFPVARIEVRAASYSSVPFFGGVGEGIPAGGLGLSSVFGAQVGLYAGFVSDPTFPTVTVAGIEGTPACLEVSIGMALYTPSVSLYCEMLPSVECRED